MFAPSGQYPACGMFSTAHIVSLVICVLLIALMVYVTRRIDSRKLHLITMIMAFVITGLEITKIVFNFYYGYTTKLNHWLPLSFCSMFIYALWCSGFGKGKIAVAANSYITGGAFFAGLCFLFVPATSLTMYPIFHFQCLYSMLFHSCMVYMAIMNMRLNTVRLDLRHFRYFFFFYAAFASVALILNVLFDENLMLLMEPFNLPFGFFYTIREFSVVAYVVFISLGYTVVNYGATVLVKKLVNLKTVDDAPVIAEEEIEPSVAEK